MFREKKKCWDRFKKIALIISTAAAILAIIGFFTKTIDSGEKINEVNNEMNNENGVNVDEINGNLTNIGEQIIINQGDSGSDLDEEQKQNSKPIMGESNYLDYLRRQVDGKILFRHFCDYDGDGFDEMFALVESYSDEAEDWVDYCGKIWFVNHDGAIEVESDALSYYHPYLLNMGEKLFAVFPNVWATGSSVYIWGVTDGEPRQPIISGKGSNLSINEFNELELTHSTYDSSLDKEKNDKYNDLYIDNYGNAYPLMSGHTWKKYYFYFDGNVFKEYGGINIEIDDLLRSYKGREIVEKIYEESYVIDSIYYRDNGIININVSKEDDQFIQYSNLTLRYNNGKFDIVPSEWGDYNDGIYLEAMIPEIATYPSEYPY